MEYWLLCELLSALRCSVRAVDPAAECSIMVEDGQIEVKLCATLLQTMHKTSKFERVKLRLQGPRCIFFTVCTCLLCELYAFDVFLPLVDELECIYVWMYRDHESELVRTGSTGNRYNPLRANAASSKRLDAEWGPWGRLRLSWKFVEREKKFKGTRKFQQHVRLFSSMIWNNRYVYSFVVSMKSWSIISMEHKQLEYFSRSSSPKEKKCVCVGATIRFLRTGNNWWGTYT